MPIIGFIIGTAFGYWIKGTSISPSIDKMLNEIKDGIKNKNKKNQDE